MTNTREFCNEYGNEHALVAPIVDVRDNLGALAAQVLAAKADLATMDSCDIIRKFYETVCELHTAYDQERERIDYII